MSKTRLPVDVQSSVMWYRAWFVPETGELQITRTGLMRKADVIQEAEEQFGMKWATMVRHGVRQGGGARIRAVRGFAVLSPNDKSFESKSHKARR